MWILRRALLGSTSIAALGASTLLAGETDGLAIDFTSTAYFDNSTWDQAWNQVRDTSADTFSSPHTFYTNSGTSAKVVKTSSTGLGWSPHNGLVQSQTFGTSWNGGVLVTVTSNDTTAPDGTATADTIHEASDVDQYHTLGSPSVTIVANVSYTLSLYVKQGTGSRNVLYGIFKSDFTQGFWLRVNPSTGAVVTSGADGVATLIGTDVTDVGSGWYRISVTGMLTTTGPCEVDIQFNDGTTQHYNGDGTSTLHIWGAQLNRGIVPTAYVATTGSVKYGLPISYGEGLLVEPAATNMLIRSQEFDNAAWSLGSCTRTADQVAAPDGSTTADLLTASAGSGTHNIYKTADITVTTATNYTTSIYVKAGTATYFQVSMTGTSTDWITAVYDLSNGTVTSTSDAGASSVYSDSSITSVGNGWYRLTLTGSTTDTAVGPGFAIVDSGTPSFGNFSNVTWTAAGTETAYLWGAQTELGTVATSYIPTVSATVTRATDKPNCTTASFGLSATNGTVVAWFASRSANEASNYYIFDLTDGTTGEEIRGIGLVSDTPDSLCASVTDGGSTVVDGTVTKTGAVSTSGNKAAWFYKANDSGVLADGGVEVSDTACTMPTVTTLALGYSVPSSSPMNGFIKRLIYVPRRMTSSEMRVATGALSDSTLLSSYIDGLGIDFTDTSYFDSSVWNQDWNQVRTSSVDSLSSPHTFYTNSGTSAKVVKTSSTGLGWSPHNLLTYSQTLTTADVWNDFQHCTVDANQAVAPDGTTTAELLTGDGTTDTHNCYYQADGSWTGLVVIANVNYAVSFYIKAGTSNYAYVGTGNGTDGFGAVFDLSNGTLGETYTASTGTVTTSIIEDVGNGWYRCTAVGTVTNTTQYPQVGLAAAATGNTFSGSAVTSSSSDTIYIWGAQVNRGIAPTAYVATTTAVKYGLPVSYGEGLLVEPAATNICLRSEDLTTTWANSGSSESANATTAPDGSVTADKLVENSTAGVQHRIKQSISVTSGNAYTFSVYLKAGERTWAELYIGSGGFADDGTAWFDLTNGTVETLGADTEDASITSIGNGWYRCAITATADATAANEFNIYIADGDGTDTFDGDGISGIYVWGAQVETGTVATSYIPTVSATVTRAADLPNVATSAYPHSATEGTFVVWAVPSTINQPTVDGRLFWLGTDGNNAIVFVYNHSDTPDALGFYVANGGVTQVDNTVTKTGTASLSGNKGAAFYKANDCGVLADAGSEVADTSCTLPTMTTLRIGSDITTSQLSGFIERLTYVPLRLTAAEMQDKTT